MSAPALPTYRVTVTREIGLWAATVDGLPPGVVGATDVERHADLDDAVRDLIAGLTEVDTSDFHVQWAYVQKGRDYTQVVLGLDAWETQAGESTAVFDAYRHAAIQSMRGAGLSMRDIADLLGISHQRVSQLVAQGVTQPRSGTADLDQAVLDAVLSAAVAEGLDPDHIPERARQALPWLVRAVKGALPQLNDDPESLRWYAATLAVLAQQARRAAGRAA